MAPVEDVASSGQVTSDLILDRYRLDSGPPLGTGGWCVVRKAEDTLNNGKLVAVKTFGAQAVRELGTEALLARFRGEIRTFETVGVAPSSPSTPPRRGPNPRDFFVNLLDYSQAQDSNEPGPAPDGQLYTVLELADCALDVWLKRRLQAANFVGLQELRQVAASLAQGLSLLHQNDLCHLDVKPENVMLFGDKWKLIDLESCMSSTGSRKVAQNSFTPLYASPELARFALDSAQGNAVLGPSPSGSMDTWAAGVVLMDILAHKAAFDETKAGFDAAYLFEEEAVPFEGWYRWLSSSAPIDLTEILAGHPAGSSEGAVSVLETTPQLKALLSKLLEKDPTLRLTAADMLALPLLAKTAEQASNREQVESVFESWDKGCGVFARNFFYELLIRVGLSQAEAELFLEAVSPSSKGEPLTYRQFLDFLYGSTS